MAAKFANGTTFSIGGDLVGELTGISLPDRSRDEVETTAHGDTDRTYVAGLRDGGSVTLEGRLAMGAGNVGQTAIEANYAAASSAATEAMVITLPDNAGISATTFTFNGFVTSINGDLPMDDVGSFSVTIKVSGAVTKTLAT
jgi:hypothetical protein